MQDDPYLLEEEPEKPAFETNDGGMLPVLPPASPNAGQQKRENFKSIISTILILLLAPLLALGITAFVFQSYEVDGPSMQSTLETKDRLIVWKFGHTLSRLSKKHYIPERGSIVVFVKRGLYDFNSDKDKQLIKRVIALPGEKVLVKDGVVTVYNKEHPEGFNPDKTLGIESTIMGNTVGEAEFTVDDGQIFVMGDHRDNSLDSRIFGPIPSSDIVGTLSARILPLSEAKKF